MRRQIRTGRFNKWLFILLPVLLLFGFLHPGCFRNNVSRKVGVLSGSDLCDGITDAFIAEMKELGYGEGDHVVYEIRGVNSGPEAEQRAAEELKTLGVDLILAYPTRAAVAAGNIAGKAGIPVVFANTVIEGVNLIDDLLQPGGNLTGVQLPVAETTLKRLEILQIYAPSASRIHVMYDEDYPGVTYVLETLRQAAPIMGLVLVEVPVRDNAGVQEDLDSRLLADDAGVDAVLVMPTLLTEGPPGFSLLRKFAEARNLPLGGSTQQNAVDGAVFGYAPDCCEMGKLAAGLAQKIFQGVSAGTIPVVTPEILFYINYDTIETLKLPENDFLLSLATRIYRR